MAPSTSSVAPGQGSGTATETAKSRQVSIKIWLLGGVVLSLLCILAFAVGRETGPRSQPAAPAARPAVLATPRPALTAAEEAYSQALWMVHNDVKSSALRMTMSGIQYKTQRVDATGLRTQVLASLETYRVAEHQIRALQPPSSLQPVHDDYLQAVLLYQQSATEMVKLAEDQREEHLLAAFPMSQDAGRKLRSVGAVLWPGEYVPS
jgi:hypothetical protein